MSITGAQTFQQDRNGKTNKQESLLVSEFLAHKKSSAKKCHDPTHPKGLNVLYSDAKTELHWVLSKLCKERCGLDKGLVASWAGYQTPAALAPQPNVTPSL